MSDEGRAILEAARKLPPEEQVLIAEALYREHGYELAEMSEEEWAAELGRRTAETDQGVRGIPWREVLGDDK
jgi:hypothetical protein